MGSQSQSQAKEAQERLVAEEQRAAVSLRRSILNELNLDVQTTPSDFQDFIGQEEVKGRIQAELREARENGRPLQHTLLVGPAGSGRRTLACIVACALAKRMKLLDYSRTAVVPDLAGVFTHAEEGDIVFIVGFDSFPRQLGQLFFQATGMFQYDLRTDEHPSARIVRHSLRRFTAIATAVSTDRIHASLLSCFPMVARMSDYSTEQLTTLASRFAAILSVDVDSDALQEIVRSSRKTASDLLYRLQHVRDFAVARNHLATISRDAASEALLFLAEAEALAMHGSVGGGEERQTIPSHVRRDVWRRDNGQCSRCGSRINLEFDHIIPVAKGGSSTARNVELLCEECNRKKRDRIE